MKKFFKRLAIVVVVLVLAVVGLFASIFLGRAKLQDGQVLGSARTVKDGFVAAYMVDTGPGKVLLVDAGNDPAATAILAELTRRGLGKDAVSAIFLTHGHPDHLAGCAQFPDAPTYLLTADVDLAEGRAAGKGLLPSLFGRNKHPVHITHTLVDGDVTVVGTRTVKTFAVPGHTAGSAAFLIDGVLFLGDSADSDGSGHLQGAVRAFSESAGENHQSLVALAARLAPTASEIKWLAPAHSGALAGLAPLTAFADANR